jgi:hypothetical protein
MHDLTTGDEQSERRCAEGGSVQGKGEKTVVSLPSSALPVLTGLEIEIGAAERHSTEKEEPLVSK